MTGSCGAWAFAGRPCEPSASVRTKSAQLDSTENGVPGGSSFPRSIPLLTQSVFPLWKASCSASRSGDHRIGSPSGG